MVFLLLCPLQTTGLSSRHGILRPARRAGSLRVASGRARGPPGPSGSGPLYTVRCDRSRRHGAHGGTLRPQPPRATAARGGDVQPGPGPGRGRDRLEGLIRALGSRPQCVACPWAKQVFTGPRGLVLGGTERRLGQRAVYRLCVLRRGTVLLLRSSGPALGARLLDGAGSILAGPSDGHRRRPRGPWLNEEIFKPLCVFDRGSSPPARV